MRHLRILFLAVALLWPAIHLQAQTDLTGRVYENKNIMADMLNESGKDIDAQLAQARSESIAEAEKKKGRKLTAAEIAEYDEKVVEGKKMLEAMQKGMTTRVGVEFQNAKELLMRMEMKISDEALKAAGVSWLKRKAMKAALAIMPKSHKVKYVVQGNLIITTDDDGKDTLRISNDGKFLYGTFDDKTEVKLTRIK